MTQNTKRINELITENRRLKKALEGLICWAGKSPNGPEWATPEAKAKNRQMFHRALDEAVGCFPEDYDGFLNTLSSN